MRDASQLFRRAADLHFRGQLETAERLYREILAEQPAHFDARHFLGVLQSQQGRRNEALASIEAALRTNPDFPPALVNCAAVLRALGRTTEALARLDRALALKADYPEALYNRGLALQELDRTAAALASFERALALRPDYLEALMSRANALRRLNRPAEALATCDRILAIRGDLPDAHLNRANALRNLNRLPEALASFERALALRPSDVAALISQGNVLRDLKRPAEALACYEKAVAIKPDHAGALYSRGNALADLNRLVEALASFDQALLITPDNAEALNNRAGALRSLGRAAEALASCEQALAIKPDHADALYNRGNALGDLRRPAEALASFDQALAIRPDHVAALNNRAGALRSLGRPAEALESLEQAAAIDHSAETLFNRACARLLLGDFDGGWQDYEWRWKTPDQAHWQRSFSQPLWLGEQTLEGRSLLVHAEQGFGDAIQFARYVPLLAARAGRVILEVQPALKALLSRLEGASLVVGRGEALPAFDCHCPLASLPLAFKTRLETIPADIPYLTAVEERVIKWQTRLPTSALPRIGIAWGGNPVFRDDATRSIGLARLAPLLACPGVAFVGLQKDLRSGDREILREHPALTYLGDAIEDFDDTAAIMSALDLIISSDTSIVHLAGALGKPVWILLQCAADWRWLTERADSPWYPTARLFRQPAFDDWESVLGELRAALDAWAAARSGWSP